LKLDPEESLRSFFKQNKPFLYKRREVILRGEEIPHGIFYLEKGYIKNYFVSANGEEFTFIIYRKGDFFPIAWTFNDTRKAYYFEAMTPCVLYKKGRPEFLKFLNENPDILLHIMGKITRRLDGLLERMEHMAFGNAYNRVCSIIYILGERFGTKSIDGSKIILNVPLTHKDIANLLGTARETVSVEIAKLKKEGVIKSSGKYIHILSPIKLRRESLIS